MSSQMWIRSSCESDWGLAADGWHLLCRIPLCAADRSIPAVESIAGDEAAAAELDRLARLMEQQAILEKVQHIFAWRLAFLNKKAFTETYFLLYSIRSGSVPVLFFIIFFIIFFSTFCCNMLYDLDLWCRTICTLLWAVLWIWIRHPVPFWPRTRDPE